MLKGIGVRGDSYYLYHCKLRERISVSLNPEINRVLEKNWPLFDRAPWRATSQLR